MIGMDASGSCRRGLLPPLSIYNSNLDGVLQRCTEGNSQLRRKIDRSKPCTTYVGRSIGDGVDLSRRCPEKEDSSESMHVDFVIYLNKLRRDARLV
jgi:hypothetical protein